MNHLYQQELVNFLCKVPDSNILACLGPLDSEGTTQACHFSMIVVIDFIHTHTHTHTHTLHMDREIFCINKTICMNRCGPILTHRP